MRKHKEDANLKVLIKIKPLENPCNECLIKHWTSSGG